MNILGANFEPLQLFMLIGALIALLAAAETDRQTEAMRKRRLAEESMERSCPCSQSGEDLEEDSCHPASDSTGPTLH